MALGLTPEHLEPATALRRWAERHCPTEVVRAAADGTDAGAAQYRAGLAAGLADQGLFGLHLAQADGGQGFGLPELAVALEELGRVLLPGAFLPTVLASAVLAESARSGRTGLLLAKLADGSLTAAVCLSDGLLAEPSPDLRGNATGNTNGSNESAPAGLAVSGVSGPVMAGSMADVIIAPVQTAGGEIWAALDAADLDVTVVEGVDRTRPLATVRADGIPLPAGWILTGVDRTTVSSLAAIVFGAEACGIADWAVRTAAEYAKIRHQFGRPIGQFQAVKHRCAWMLTWAEMASAAAWDAARTEPDAAAAAPAALGETPAADQPPASRQREFAASVAAVLAVDAAVSCVNDCIQVLGGIGYTWDHEAQLYYRRALSLRALLGSSVSWAERVDDLARAGVRRPVQIELPGGDAPLRAQLAGELAEIAALSGRERAQRLAEGGWVIPHLPRPWGRGANALEQMVIEQEMHAAGVKAPSLMIGAWVVPALIQYGTAEQQERFLPPTLRGEIIWCQLFSEPGAGSDLAGLTTRAVRADGGWRITGQKIWTSLAKQAAWAICIARTDPAAARHGGITYFLVDMSDPGVEVRPLREMTGESFFNQVFLDDVFVPDDRVVGGVNGGWRVARTTLANERVSLSKSWTFGSGVTELLEQVQAGSPAPAAQLGSLVAEGHAIDLLDLRVTMKRLSGTEPGATGSVRKLLGMRHAQQVAEFCWAMSGADGALGAGPEAGLRKPEGLNGPHWARQVLTTRALTIGGGTTDIQLNIISERILGLPRDPDPPAA
jgi:alkylation response protein AidB-like acyl-CoA dehydrogenase